MRDLLDFTGKTVVVTGGSTGIGNGIARAFRDHGAKLIITASRERAAYDTDMDGMDYHQVDIADDDAMRAFAAQVSSLDVLVNSVGTVVYKRKEFQMPTFRHVVDVNLNGVMHACVLFHDKLLATKGNIVNIASVASFRPTRGNPAYSASKGGLALLTKSLADAWGPEGIRVNGLAPGFVATKITAVSYDNPEINEGIVNTTPLRRWGTPEEMGQVALFLASDMASFMTGHTIPVDGGQSL
ncbi:MAG: SDR family oxidoreductase [Alphaproteobacteria bacterium]|nr:SDR family oxidoreductase [Alphaproteobacteria bacterium]